MSKSALEDLFLFQMRAANLPQPEREHYFHPVRKWRFDFAWPDRKLAFEIQGGIWKGGRHVRGIGFEADCEKHAEAILLGWRVFTMTSGMVKSGRALEYLERALQPPPLESGRDNAESM